MSLFSGLSMSQAARAWLCTRSLSQVDASLDFFQNLCTVSPGGLPDPSLQPAVGQCLPVVRSLLLRAVEFIIHSSKRPPGLLAHVHFNREHVTKHEPGTGFTQSLEACSGPSRLCVPAAAAGRDTPGPPVGAAVEVGWAQSRQTPGVTAGCRTARRAWVASPVLLAASSVGACEPWVYRGGN